MITQGHELHRYGEWAVVVVVSVTMHRCVGVLLGLGEWTGLR